MQLLPARSLSTEVMRPWLYTYAYVRTPLAVQTYGIFSNLYTERSLKFSTEITLSDFQTHNRAGCETASRQIKVYKNRAESDGIFRYVTEHFTVEAGSHNIDCVDDGQQNIGIADLRTNKKRGYYNNDIALLKLDSPIIFSDTKQTIVLPEEGTPGVFCWREVVRNWTWRYR